MFEKVQRCGGEDVAQYDENAVERNEKMHDVAVAREQCCRVGVLVV